MVELIELCSNDTSPTTLFLGGSVTTKIRSESIKCHTNEERDEKKQKISRGYYPSQFTPKHRPQS